MAQTPAEQKTALLEKAADAIKTRLPAEKANSVADFCRAYFRHVAPDDLLDLDAENIYGIVLSHWNFAHARPADTAIVRAYNPSFDEHGWQSTHTVIEIVTDDMPFLVDSVIMELNRQGLRVHLIIHPIFQVQRNKAGELQALSSEGKSESFMHCQVDRQTDPAAFQKLEQNLLRILKDVRTAVEDWPQMLERMRAAIADLDVAKTAASTEELDEIKAFLNWAADRNFIFLGYRDYDLVEENGQILLRNVPNSGLGVLRDDGVARISPSFAELPPELRQLAGDPNPLIVSKSGARSSVHRPVHMDYIGVKRFDENGKVIGEQRFLGLYTAVAYTRTPGEMPLLRAKVKKVIERSGLKPGSHAGRALQTILDTFPRDELFQATDDELFDSALGILHLQERQRLRLFVRQDMFQRFVSCLVYVPRERYGTDLRLRMQDILLQAFNGHAATFSTQFSESVLARVHFHIRTQPGQIPEYSVSELEARLTEAMKSWDDELYQALLESLGEAQGNLLFPRYSKALPAAYKEDFSPRMAAGDIQQLETVAADKPLAMRLYRSLENPEALLHFKVFGPEEPLPLSDALPILERMGLRVLNAHPYELEFADGSKRWVLNFDMQEDAGIQVDVTEVRDIFQQAFAQIWNQSAENDGFNRLVLGAEIGWRDVVMLRAYCKYLLQTRVPFSQDYMQQTLAAHPAIVQKLVQLFHVRFDPGMAKRDVHSVTLQTDIEEALEQVSSLDEDRILRRYLAAIKATLRTNFFQAGEQRQPKEYVSFKFDPAKIPELPKPLPMFEIFVYSPRVEAVHLRGGPVARGGLRWSDRREDFRTEVLGLMKAQMVKNSVIVPVGSKGGFVVKHPQSSREAMMQEVQDCYKTFIRGLLDITDNRRGDSIIPPPDVVRHDNNDPYLVVAADKGTATFSDLANSVAIEYGFWLGDAFASGGANGYDHKGMGITARGAWESVKRHFREMGMDIQNRDDFTVVGIGDMAGDVFGNGMLLSRHIKLVAAFNHLHIFIDPDPDPEASYQERERLFKLPRSSWADYKAELISKGGGIYPRSAKSIALSPQVREALSISENQLTPTELINRLLKAPVDLLWNGGIGTYVKASSETHADADDRTNDALRVNASQLRCKVIGEGGNLGLTQLARIEFALRGGRVLTDAIDNSAGVNCSDHEVNIKILLNQVVANGDMTEKQRNTLLAEMTDEVAQLVLRQNYLQPEAISITASVARDLLSDHSRVIRSLERSGKLDRALEFLPSDEDIAEREANGQGLTGPELAVLLAYSKMNLFEELIQSDVPEDAYLQQELLAYFPEPLQERYSELMQSHPLRREIIATYITNSVLNRMGSAYVIRLQEDSGEAAPDIARAYSAARALFDARALWHNIDALDNQIDAAVQIKMHLESRRMLERTSQWLLRNRRSPLNIETVFKQFKTGIDELALTLPELLKNEQQQQYEQALQELIDAGVPDGLARQVVSLPALYSALDIIEVAENNQLPVVDAARVYFSLAERLEIGWLRHSIMELPVATHWQRRARAALLNGLYDLGRALTGDVIRSQSEQPDVDKRMGEWLKRNQNVVERCLNMFTDLRSGGQHPDLAMLSVALREVSNLAQAA